MEVRFSNVAYQGSIVSMGGQKVIGLLKSIRTELGTGPGDVVAVTLEADRAERVVSIPDDLRAALDDAGLGDKFAAELFASARDSVVDSRKRRSPKPGPAASARRLTDSAAERFRARQWWHTIDVAPGVVTPGSWELRPAAKRMPWPANGDLSGLRCLDVGAIDGFWAFECASAAPSAWRASRWPCGAGPGASSPGR